MKWNYFVSFVTVVPDRDLVAVTLAMAVASQSYWMFWYFILIYILSWSAISSVWDQVKVRCQSQPSVVTWETARKTILLHLDPLQQSRKPSRAQLKVWVFRQSVSWPRPVLMSGRREGTLWLLELTSNSHSHSHGDIKLVWERRSRVYCIPNLTWWTPYFTFRTETKFCFICQNKTTLTVSPGTSTMARFTTTSCQHPG